MRRVLPKSETTFNFAGTEEVYRLLETSAKLRRIPLKGGSFVFASPDLETNDQRLMILIHGSGVVRAGQWTRWVGFESCRWPEASFSPVA